MVQEVVQDLDYAFQQTEVAQPYVLESVLVYVVIGSLQDHCHVIGVLLLIKNMLDQGELEVPLV